MSETFSAADKPCPNCGGLVAADSRFCKHCAFDFAAPPQPLSQTGDGAPVMNRYVLPAVGVAAVLVLAVVAEKSWFRRLDAGITPGSR